MPILTTLPQETLLHIFQDLTPDDILKAGKARNLLLIKSPFSRTIISSSFPLQTCKALQSQVQDRYLWLIKARKSLTRTPNSHYYRPLLTTLSTEELKRDSFRETWVDSGWKIDGFKPAYMKSFTLSQTVSNPIILPGGDFVLFSSLSGRISLRRIDNLRTEMALNEVASHQLKSAGASFTIRPMHTQAGVILANWYSWTGFFIVELLKVNVSPPYLVLTKSVKVCASAEAIPVATCAQDNVFACLMVTTSRHLHVLVTTVSDPEQDGHKPDLLLQLDQELRPHGHTMCMPSPNTIVVCDGPTVHMYNIPAPGASTAENPVEVTHVWRWDDPNPERNIPLSPNIVFWRESTPPTLHLISEYGNLILTFDTIGTSSELNVKEYKFKALQTEEVGDLELRRFIPKGEKGLLCHEDSITPGQILRTISFDKPDFNIHYVRLYHENFWSSGLEDYWIEDLDFDEVSGRMVFQCTNLEEEDPFKIFIVDMV